MKYKYKFNELDCANCANAIEQKLNSDKNIKTASVNFSKLSLIVETDLDKDVKKYVNNIIASVEPDSFVIDIGEGLLELINPEIIATSGEQIDAEGCLSIPGEDGEVKRPYVVRVRAQDRNGNTFEIEGEELLARAFCHEIDHLDGILFVDKVEK